VPLLSLVAWLVGLYFYWTRLADRELRETVAEIDRLDPEGWEIDAILAARQQVPDKENAALQVQAVKMLLPPGWPLAGPAAPPEPPCEPGAEGANALAAQPPMPWEQQLHEIPPQVQLDEALRRDLQASLDRAKEALPEAHKLIGMTWGRYPLEWQANCLSILLQSQDARSAAMLLQMEAIALAHDRKSDEALDRVRGILAAARSLGDEPTIISMLIHVACDAVAISTLERILAQGEPSAKALQAVQRVLEMEAGQELLLTASRGERAGYHALMEAVKRGDVTLSQVVGPPGGTTESRLLDLTGPTLARRSHARLLRLMTEFVEIAKRPPHEQNSLMKELDSKIRKAKVEYDVMVGLLMPAIIKCSEAHRRGLGSLRCAIAAAAAERYRIDQGRWPERLEDLVTKYLPAVPKDPGDGKALRYARLPDGVLIYWVGLDGEDNGGALNRKNPNARQSDGGFRLWDAAARRQPPAEVVPAPTEAPDFGPDDQP
jgi:hypothetical protein